MRRSEILKSQMPKRFFKFRLLLDENLPPRSRFPKLNGRYTILHIAHDLKKSGLSDKEVYKLAVKQKLVIVTFNYRDFPTKDINRNSGIIGISPNTSIEQIDTKLTALLTKSKKGQLYGKFTNIFSENLQS